ncbi:MAG: radical SAM protein [Deltaproteobacteria bacterium]
MNWKQKQKYEALLSRERGVVKKVWGTGHTVCLAYPNAYRIGMANLGFQTVYRLFNDLPSFLCERAFWPPAGGGAESAAGGAPLVSLESQNPLRNFDLLAFSLSFENDYPAVLQMLEAAGIPLAAEDRDLAHPLVMGGGIAPTLNPEPLAAFFDLFVLGEAEEILPAFARVFAATAGLDRRDRLVALQRQLPGVYVPSLYGVSYFPEGPIRRMIPLADGLPETIRIGRIRNIGAFSTTQTVSSPDSEMADMYLVEVNRGCPHLCRFCAAGHVYAPPRFRPARDIIEAVDRGLALKGKIGLVGTAVSDHPDLADFCRHIVARGAAVGVGSLRVDRITGEMLDLLKAGRVETVALAPEAGSQRLRDLVRKDITDADILAAARLLLEKDILNLRLYFMVGLPTEEEEDIDAIIGLAKKIQHTALLSTTGQKKFRRLTLSVNQFIPKPRTPLQWCALTEVQDVNRRIRKIVSAFRRDRQITVLADVPKWNFVQALLSLGDRRVGDILLAVHRRGGHWLKALREININPDFYVYRPKKPDEILPWDIVDVGLPKKALIREYRKAFPDLS